ncbi:MAG TPA: hypothetical protein VFS44_01805 [Gemmatimonadaceae bacterium]|nr:hypothetical protein [Gemmatimonadaceae bacterium]
MLIALVAELTPDADPAADSGPSSTMRRQLLREQRQLHAVLDACGVDVVPVGRVRGVNELRQLARALVLDEVAFVPPDGWSADLLDWARRGRHLVRLASPGLLDGRNVLQVDRQLFVGVPPGASDDALRAAAEAVAAYDYHVVPVPLSARTVLRHACSYVGHGTVLADVRIVEAGALARLDVLPLRDAPPRAVSVLFAPPVAIVCGRAARAAVANGGLSWASVELHAFERSGIALSDLALIVPSDDEAAGVLPHAGGRHLTALG